MDNYKKKYDEALERAKKELNACGSQDCDAAKQIFRLFPELVESEDERIREELITHCRNTRCVTEEGAERIAKWIAWLEKQGEHANFLSKIQVGDKVTRNEDGVLVNLSQLRRVAKPRKKQGEQKPAWSEEDEKTFVNLISYGSSKYTGEQVIEWLNSLKQRMGGK